MLQLLIPTPNLCAEVGFNRDRFLLNPSKVSLESLKLFKFLGVMMGVSIRTKRPLNLHLSPSVWKEIVGISLSINDIEEVIMTIYDLNYFSFYEYDTMYHRTHSCVIAEEVAKLVSVEQILFRKVLN